MATVFTTVGATAIAAGTYDGSPTLKIALLRTTATPDATILVLSDVTGTGEATATAYVRKTLTGVSIVNAGGFRTLTWDSSVWTTIGNGTNNTLQWGIVFDDLGNDDLSLPLLVLDAGDITTNGEKLTLNHAGTFKVPNTFPIGSPTVGTASWFLGTAPVATILQPLPSETIHNSQVTTLIGTATDNEDGVVTDVEWASDLDGSLGISAELNVSGLSVGVHTLTFTATDADGNPTSVTTRLTVEDDLWDETVRYRSWLGTRWSRWKRAFHP